MVKSGADDSESTRVELGANSWFVNIEGYQEEGSGDGLALRPCN